MLLASGYSPAHLGRLRLPVRIHQCTKARFPSRAFVHLDDLKRIQERTMAEPNSVVAWTAWGVMGTVLSMLEPMPAMGALFGCFFFLSMPSPSTGWRRKTMLMLFSLGLGYSVGIAVSSIGGYERFAMLCAAAVSALGASSFASLHNYQNGGPVPAWLEATLDRLPFLNKRGDGNG